MCEAAGSALPSGVYSSNQSSKGLLKSGLYRCDECPAKPSFITSQSFKDHLRSCHCRIEGGSFVCLYGSNSVCATLPLEGVSDVDYNQHVVRQHILSGTNMSANGKKGLSHKQQKNSEEKWGLFSPTQNIPSALQNPKKGITRDFFTRTWGESFVEVKSIPEHVALPEVTLRHIEPYNRRIKKRGKLLLRLQQHEEHKQEQLLTLSSARNQSRDGTEGPPIPQIYFSQNFNLKDMNTFYSVFSHLAPSRKSSGEVSQTKVEAKQIQDNLLFHLEVVEGKMCNHIASKSSAFFQSMSHLSVHMDQLKQNQNAVTSLRKEFSLLHKEAVHTPLTLLSYPRRRVNILKTYRILEMMSVVKEVQGTIRVMLSRREFITALDLIHTACQLLENDLSTIRSFRNMSGELTEQVRIIEKMVSLDFTKYVTEDLNRPLDDDAPLLGEDQLIAAVFGVLRLNKFDFLDNLKEEMYAAINASVKQCVAESVSKSNTANIDEAETSASAAHNGTNNTELTGVGEQARTLPLSEWLPLLHHLTNCLQLLLRRYKAITDVISQAVSASTGKQQSEAGDVVHAASIVSNYVGMESEMCSKILQAIGESLCHACDFSHDRCAKLLHARSRNNGLAKMSVSEFMSLSGVIESFVCATEKICGRKSTPFRQGLQGQCVVFVQRFHTDREGRLRANLSNERWKAVPVPADMQVLCSNIDSSGKLVSSEKVVSSDDISDNDDGRTHVTCDSDDRTNTSSKDSNCTNSCDDKSLVTDRRKMKAKSNGVSDSTKEVVVLGGEKYVVVGIGVVVVRLMVEYAECASTLHMAAQTLLSGLADLLKRFNSDTCRLLLEAGAVSLGGLRTISTKHLALAHRCLHLLLSLLPHLQSHFSELLKPTMVEKTVSQLSREFREHCSAIESKIISVVGDQFDKQLSTWEARSPVPSPSISGILKSLTRLHEAINGVLTQQQVCDIFSRLTVSLRVKLKSHLLRLGVNPVGPQSWVVTSELTFYFNHLSSLKVDPKCSQEEFGKLLWASK